MADNNGGSGSEWLRLLFMLVYFFVLFYVMKLVVSVILIVQFVFRLATGEANERLRGFSEALARYGHQILDYATYVGDDRPWPFSDWPGRQGAADTPAPPASRDDTD